MAAPAQPTPDADVPQQVDLTEAAEDRDAAAEVRDQVASDRDDAGDLRDDAAGVRDRVSSRRDVAARHRDAAAAARDADALRRERAGDLPPSQAPADAAKHSAAARQAAALDRQRASLDREAGADERDEAQRDRSTAQGDRSDGATERDHAGDDRDASARDREVASLDSLTGAYVRGPGLLELERELVRARRTRQQLTIAFLDVDHLKQVNDNGGHAAGDRLLERVAAAMRHRLRTYDLVIRYGGDEFVCVLAGVGVDEAERRFALVNSDLAPYGSVTVGVATAGDEETSAELLERADAVLYARRALRPALA